MRSHLLGLFAALAMVLPAALAQDSSESTLLATSVTVAKPVKSFWVTKALTLKDQPLTLTGLFDYSIGGVVATVEPGAKFTTGPTSSVPTIFGDQVWIKACVVASENQPEIVGKGGWVSERALARASTFRMVP
jgi:hypothetical protein